jgi:pyruvate kinase
VEARAEHAGQISQRKGINLPDSDVSAPAISDKDRADVLFAVAQKVDFIAMSFVRRAQDIQALQQLIEGAGGHQAIIAKIEKPQALDNLEAILQASWGVMVARGDLGVELSASLVPMAQKRIIRAARRLGKPVITATQMLDSMTRNPRPTRAEASDVANAVLDGTDAVMLSQETAVGTYPTQTVRMMGEIIDAVESDEAHAGSKLPAIADEAGVGQVLAHAACAVAEAMGAPAIATYTETGCIAQLVSQRRPHVPIVALATTPGLEHKLCLVWGVVALAASAVDDGDDDWEGALDALLVRRGLARANEHVVLMVGAPNGRTGSTNSIMVHRIGDKRRPSRGLYGAASL